MKMEQTAKVSSLFNIGYGTKLDFKQMQTASASDMSVCRQTTKETQSRSVTMAALVKRFINPSHILPWMTSIFCIQNFDLIRLLPCFLFHSFARNSIATVLEENGT